MNGNGNTIKIERRGFRLSEAVEAIAENYDNATGKIRRVSEKLRRRDRAVARAAKFSERVPA